MQRQTTDPNQARFLVWSCAGEGHQGGEWEGHQEVLPMAWDSTSQQPYPVLAARPPDQSPRSLHVPLSSRPLAELCSGLTHCLFLQLAELSITRVGPPPLQEGGHRHSYILCP